MLPLVMEEKPNTLQMDAAVSDGGENPTLYRWMLPLVMEEKPNTLQTDAAVSDGGETQHSTDGCCRY